MDRLMSTKLTERGNVNRLDDYPVYADRYGTPPLDVADRFLRQVRAESGRNPYTGHRPGGDPVQEHSAGDLYPYVIAVVESPERGREYEIVGPKVGSGWRFKRADDAERCAKNWKDWWERRPRPRPTKTLGDYLANKYAIPYPDSEGGEQ